MLRKILMLVCLMGTMKAMAQHAPAATKNTQTENNKTDYKAVGAPMPAMLLKPEWDSTQLKAYLAQAGATGTSKKAKKKAEKVLKHGKYMYAKHVLTDKDFANGANLFVMMFNPTCSHCTDQTQLFEKNMDLFKKSRLVLMANPGMKEYMPNFLKSFHTADYVPTITVGIDSGTFMNNAFLYQALPQINIYDHDRRLIRSFTGNTSIDSLKKYIE